MPRSLLGEGFGGHRRVRQRIQTRAPWAQPARGGASSRCSRMQTTIAAATIWVLLTMLGKTRYDAHVSGTEPPGFGRTFADRPLGGIPTTCHSCPTRRVFGRRCTRFSEAPSLRVTLSYPRHDARHGLQGCGVASPRRMHDGATEKSHA